MMRKPVLLVLAFCIALVSFSQETKEDIQKKQKELLSEIAALNSNLNEIKKNKKQSLGQLALVQRKLQARQELIRSINKDLHRLNDAIYQNQLQINRYKKEYDTLKDMYAKSLMFAYKNRSNYDYLNFLFSASSFNDALKRVAYLRSYRQYRETQVENIRKTQQLLQQEIDQMSQNKKEKATSLEDQGKQLTVLEDDKKEKDQVVNELKSRESEIAKQLREKEKTRQRLEVALQAVIRREIEAAKKKEQERLAKIREEERQKKLAAEKAAAANATASSAATAPTVENPPKEEPVKVEESTKAVTTKNTNRSYSPFESTKEEANVSINFEKNRGNLRWPADQGFVSTHFGPYQVPGTKLRGDMPGIEISLPVGSAIKAVADGVVSAIFDLGSGQTVVIRHGKYFTAYSGLTNVAVEKGQEVKAGRQLGNAALGVNGDGLVIFMVSNDRNENLDPERWLKSR